MRKRACLVLCALTALAVIAASTPSAYVLAPNSKWPNGATVTMYLQLGDNRITLVDGATSWNDVAATTVSMWDRQLGSIDFVPRIEHRSRVSGDGVNDVFWSNDVYGDAFGDSIAVTTRWYRGDQRVEADVLFNRGKSWNSYRGPPRSGLLDFRRIALHAFGSALGLGQPDSSGQSVAAVMNRQLGSVEDLQDDDVRGIRALYGAPSQPPPPALALPSRAEAIDFRHTVETRFRAVPPTPTFVDIDAIAIWSIEYIWYRVNGCDHDAATARVLAQIEGRGVQPVCGLIASINLFPSLAHAEAFRAALEAEYRDVLKTAAREYHLNQKGDAVFVSAYVRLRFTGRNHAEAIADVFEPAPDARPEPDPPPTPPTPGPPAPTAGKYDGVYDFSWTHNAAGGGQTTRVFPRLFVVRNGRISSSDGVLAGSVTNDTFGNVEFTGPCWDGSSGGATFTGILNAGSGPKFGQGTVVCKNVHAPGGSWRVYNGR